MKSRILEYLKSRYDYDVLNLISGLFHKSGKNYQRHIPLVCKILITVFWNNYEICCALRLNQLHKKMIKTKVPHATTWIVIKKYHYKIVIKFGEFRIINVYPMFGTFSIIDPQNICNQQINQKSFIISSFTGHKQKWIIPSESENKSIKIIFEILYPDGCKSCQKEFGSERYVKIWIFHSGLDLLGGFITRLNISNLKCQDRIEIICWQGDIHCQGMLDVYKCFCYGWKIESEEHWRNKLCI